MKATGQHHAPVALHLLERIPVFTEQESGGPRDNLNSSGETSHSRRDSKPCSASPEANRYTGLLYPRSDMHTPPLNNTST